MMLHIDLNDVSKLIYLPDGLIIALLDRLGQERRYSRAECARNIYLVDADGKVIWQVESDFDADGGPFTNVLDKEGELNAYRWDGGMYVIDIHSGHATPVSLVR